MKFGAIDIGTNAARLLIGEVCQDDGHSYIKKLSYTRLPLRLGGDVFEFGEITPKKEEEFIKTMKAFQLIADIFDVKELRACATSAMREAKNGEKVAKSIAKETGIKIEVISGDEEARLIFGTFFLLDFDKTTPFIVIDVGGGSTEISVFERGERVAAKSFEVGTVRTLKQFDNIRVEDMLALREELAKYNLEDRMEKFQLKPDRADVIIPACDIYSYIFKELKVNSFAVPKVGLSDGIIYDLNLKHNSKTDKISKVKKKITKV